MPTLNSVSSQNYMIGDLFDCSALCVGWVLDKEVLTEWRVHQISIPMPGPAFVAGVAVLQEA